MRVTGVMDDGMDLQHLLLTMEIPMGEYRFDQRHGHGKYCWSDGRVYDGEFSDGKRHGKGIFEWPDGDKYTGYFQCEEQEGKRSLYVFEWWLL
jgi:hypothetical protein